MTYKEGEGEKDIHETEPLDPDHDDQDQEHDQYQDPNDEQEEDKDSAADVALVSSQPLTYFNTKHGPFYTKAKDILQTDNFDAALSKIETGLTAILSLLPDKNELHESLAPLYYMYGTTLLYSVEESQATTEASIMGQGADDTSSDLQIAWENLETARSILSKLQCSSDLEQKECMLDLAQIHSRLADLSRHNGHYEQAIRDYEACCENRRNQLQGDEVWDRRIADVEYSLGMTCLLLAAEGEKRLMDKDDDNQDEHGRGKSAKASVASLASVVAAGGDEDGCSNQEGEKVCLSVEEIGALREKSLCHYVQCARILAGIIATKAGADPNETSEADSSLDVIPDGKKPAAAAAATAVAVDNDKNDDDDNRGAVNQSLSLIQEKASKCLSSIRNRVSKLEPSQESDAAEISDLKEMLDEIQETIDNCEQDREGLRDVNQMRKMAEQEIQKADDAMDAFDASGNHPGGEHGITTIGFGATSSIIKGENGKAAVASVETSMVTDGEKTKVATVTPMMVVKKKKKAALPIDEGADGKDAKKSKIEN